MKGSLLLVTALAAVFLTDCQSTLRTNLRPSQLQSSYLNLLDQPISSRVGQIPEVLLKDLESFDSVQNYRAQALSQDETITFQKVVAELPDFLKQTLQSEVYDIYFVDNFLGGGMTYLI